MKYLTWLIASFFLSAFIVSGSSFIFERTIFNPSYLQAKAKEAELYPTLAKVIPTQLLAGQNLSPKEKARMEAAATRIITPELLEGKFSPLITELESSVKNTGAPVNLDLKDVADQLKASGVSVPKEIFDKPIVIDPQKAPQIHSSVTTFESSRKMSLYITAGLLVLLLALAIPRRQYGPLIYVFLVTALLCAVMFFVITNIPMAIQANFPPEGVLAELKPGVMQFVRSITGDVSHQFGIVALTSLGLAIVTVITSFIFKPATEKVVATPKTAKA